MKCKNCEQKEAVKYSKYSTGEFCSRECARAYSTKNKRKEINEKVSKTLTGKIRPHMRGEKNPSFKHGNYSVLNKKKKKERKKRKKRTVLKVCLNCKKEFEVEYKKRNQIYCSVSCRNLCPEYKKKITEKVKERCSSLEGRKRMREIGRKGGFGKKGYTKGGIYYQSLLEKKCFELLEENSIEFVPHKEIPNSAKVSDIYFSDKDLWIELDGIDREKRKKWIGKDYDYWLEKLQIYKDNKLNFIILKSYKEFKKFMGV